VVVDGGGGMKGTAHEKKRIKRECLKKFCLVDVTNSSFSYHGMKQLPLHRPLVK